MIVYRKAFLLLAAEGYTTYKIFEEKVLSQKNYFEMKNNRPVSTKVIERLCRRLQCQPGDILEWVPDEIALAEQQNYQNAESVRRDLSGGRERY